MGRIVVIACLLFWQCQAQAQGPNVKYINGTYDGRHDEFGRRVGFGMAQQDDGSTYRGNWVVDMRSGQGAATFQW